MFKLNVKMPIVVGILTFMSFTVVESFPLSVS